MTMNDLQTRAHSDALCIEREIADNSQPDDEDLSHAGIEFDRIVALADRHGISAGRYLEYVQDRREQLLMELWDLRRETDSR